MKRNKAPMRPFPPVVTGLYSVSPKWTDVLFGDLVQMWRVLFGK